MPVDIDVPQLRIQLEGLFCEYSDRLEVVAANLDLLLRIESNGGEESTPPYNLSGGN